MSNLAFAFQDERADAIDALHAATALYTVRPIVEGLLDRLGWPDRADTLLDPSAGDGSFLIAALDRLAPAPGDRTTALRIRGVELHPGAVISARGAVADRLKSFGWGASEAHSLAREIIIERDFLECADLGKFSIVSGNPPYLRMAFLPDFFKELYGRITPAFAQADLQHAFLAKCLDCLEPDGELAMVVSDRILFNQGASALRAYLGDRLTLDHVRRLDAATAFYRPKLRRKGTPPRCHPIEIVLTPSPDGIALTQAPISPDDPHAKHERAECTLADIASVRLAPWLGPRGIFNIDEAIAASLPREALVPIVENDDVRADDTLGAPRRYAIRTYKDQRPADAIVSHLEAALPRMPQRGKRKTWWMPPETITLDISRPGVLIPRIAKRLRAIPIPAGVLPVDHNLHITTSDTLSQSDLINLVTCDEAQDFARLHAPRLENGYLDLRASLLRRIPVHRTNK